MGGGSWSHLKGKADIHTQPKRHHVNTCVCTHDGDGRGERLPGGLAMDARVVWGMVNRWVGKKSEKDCANRNEWCIN